MAAVLRVGSLPRVKGDPLTSKIELRRYVKINNATKWHTWGRL